MSPIPPMPPPRHPYDAYREPVALAPEEEARVEAAIAEAERDLEETRVNFRWGASQVALVKRAAALAGVPYQTYLKQAVFRQAVADLKDAAAVGLTNDNP